MCAWGHKCCTLNFESMAFPEADVRRLRDVATMLADVSPDCVYDDIEAMEQNLHTVKSLYIPICGLLKAWERSINYVRCVRPLVQEVADDATSVVAGILTCADWSVVKQYMVPGTACARITVTAEGDVSECGRLVKSWLHVTSVCNPDAGGGLRDLDWPGTPSDVILGFLPKLLECAPLKRRLASADAFDRACRDAKSLVWNPRNPTEWYVKGAQVLVVFQTASRRLDVNMQQTHLGPMRLGWMIAVARSVSQRSNA